MACAIFPVFVETLQGGNYLVRCCYSLRLNLLCGESKAVYSVACFE